MTISARSKAITWIIVATIFVLATTSFTVLSSSEKTSMKEVLLLQQMQQMSEAAAAVKNYSVGQRDEADRQVRAVLNELGADIERLQQRLDKKTDHMDLAASQRARATLEDIRKQRYDF